MGQKASKHILYTDFQRARLHDPAGKRLFAVSHAHTMQIGVGRYDRQVPTWRRELNLVDAGAVLNVAIQEFLKLGRATGYAVHDPHRGGLKRSTGQVSA